MVGALMLARAVDDPQHPGVEARVLNRLCRLSLQLVADG